MEKFKYLAKNKIPKLPKTPGVYAFKKGRKFLYIGKAVDLHERAKQHRDMLSRSKHIAYIKTGSEIEALILEAKLIKKYQPKYNVMWRDDKNYFYICITKEAFPRIFTTHQIEKSQIPNPKSQTNSKSKNQKSNFNYIGPFVDGSSLKQTLKVLRKVFPYRTCKNLPKKPCLWHQLDRCPAPCLLKSKLAKQIYRGRTSIIQKECQRNAKNLMKILQGKKPQVLKDLKKEMKTFSKKEEFEDAAKVRNQIESLEKVISHASVFEMNKVEPYSSYRRIEAYDVSNIQGKEATGSMVVFTNGKPDKSQYRKFKIKIAPKPNDIAMLKEVLSRRFQHPEWPFPDLILIDGGKAQLNAALNIKCQMSNVKSMIMSLAKKENRLYVEGKKESIFLKNLPRETFNLILQLRDEAHRFAGAYHHKLRQKSLLG